jgi:predicted nucleotidyltransferase
MVDMISKDIIIEKLKQALKLLPYIYAFWLEGADAVGTADEYSDIDFWVDFEDDFETQATDAVESALSSISEIDYHYVMAHDHPKIRQRIYHLKHTSKYLMIDFCWQLHSRPKEEYCYIEGDKIEAVKVIFDKNNIIRYKEYDATEFTGWNNARLEEAKYRYTQHCRVTKYVHRNQYLEAYAYYNRYVLDPLIDILRLIHTPAYANYYLVHISQHIPERDVKQLEYFAQIASLDDIARKIPEAEEWFKALLMRLEKSYDN